MTNMNKTYQFLLLLAIFCANSINVLSLDFVSMNGPYIPTAFIYKFALDSRGYMYCAGAAETINGGYMSTDGGNNWYRIYKGLYVFSIATDDKDNILITENTTSAPFRGIYYSSDTGKSFKNILVGQGADNKIRDIYCTKEGSIFVSSKSGIFTAKSTDPNSWKLCMNGVRQGDATYAIARKVITGNDGLLYAGINQSVYYSDDNSDNWHYIGSISNDSTYSNPVYDLKVTENGTIYVTGQNEATLFISRNRDSNFTKILFPKYDSLRCLGLEVIDNNTALIGTNYGVFRTSDDGKTFELLNNGLPVKKGNDDTNADNLIYTIWQHPSTKELFLGMNGFGIYRSNDKGENWRQSSWGLNNANILSIAVSDSFVFANSQYYLHFAEKSDSKNYIWNTNSYIAGLETFNATDIKSLLYTETGGRRRLTALYNKATFSDVIISDDNGRSWRYTSASVKQSKSEVILKIRKYGNNIVALTNYRENNSFKTRFLICDLTQANPVWSEITQFTISNTEFECLIDFDISSSGYIYGTTSSTNPDYKNRFYRINIQNGVCDTLSAFEGNIEMTIKRVFITKSNTKLITTGNGKLIRFEGDNTTSNDEQLTGNIDDITTDNKGILYAVGGVLKYSENDGKTWITETIQPDDSLFTIISDGERLYAGGKKSIYTYNLNTGVVPIEKSAELEIFPNPATDYIEINVPFYLNQRFKSLVQYVRCYNVFGKEVYLPKSNDVKSSSSFQYSLRLDVSGFVPGVYFVKIGDRVQRFVKV